MEYLKTNELGKVILPQPDDIQKREKEDAMGAYLMMFAAMGAGFPLPLINLMASIIYYFINKKKSRYVAFHSFQSMITQIPISILNGFIFCWFIRMYLQDFPGFTTSFFISLGFVIIWNLIYTVFSIIASVKASRGQLYYMLFFGPISFDRFYGEKAIKKQDLNRENKPLANLPPSGF